ncbi:PID-CTERM protein-sorting domain-containing protein [Mesonia ostreae]|uniref:Uncharacterized protein n=1 Tax=Mesonia ostreae TaxID=861110 RepID=A0ABU2KJ27_9FLAO|nr:hypothetical protein [Mesonia ostreae]MDT0294722.1 hypothetical protein [Mesonia ostreae]
MKNRKSLRIIILSAAVSLVSLQGFSFQLENHELNNPTAQSGSNNNNTISEAPNDSETPQALPEPGIPPPPGTVPIDGFLTYFLVAGAFFGVRKLRKKN